LEEMKEKLRLMKDGVKRNHLRLKWQIPISVFLEGMFSTGDRNLSESWWKLFDWGAASMVGVINSVSSVERGRGEGRPGNGPPHPEEKIENIPPWSFIDTGIHAQFFGRNIREAWKKKSAPLCKRELSSMRGL